jgi:hypothetical protein
MQLKRQEQQSYHALKDEWSNNPAAFKDVIVGNGRVNIGYTIVQQPEEPQFRWGLIDEERKININNAELKVLNRLFQIVLNLDETTAQELAASIIDWRDKDSDLTIPLGSAESPYYRSLSYPYDAKNAEFQVLDEVLLVRGMTQILFMKLKDYITIYGDGKININTAPREVLLALGLSEDIVYKILSFRCGPDGIEGTQDDNIFDETSNIVPTLERAFQLNDAETNLLTTISEHYLTTASNHFMIRSIANLNNRKNTSETTCIVDHNGNILYWREP